MKTSYWRHADAIIRHERCAPIGISRSVPKWAPAGIPVFRALAPSSHLLRYAKTTDDPNAVLYDTYAERFERQLDRLAARQTWDAFTRQPTGREPVLLCWCKPNFDPPRHFCHRWMVADWFFRMLGEKVDEIDPKTVIAGGSLTRRPDEPQRSLFVAD